MRIKDIIKEKGYTQAQFAEKLGISLSALNQQMSCADMPTWLPTP